MNIGMHGMMKLKFALAAGVLMALPVTAHALTATSGTNSSLPFLALTSTGTNSGSVTGNVSGTITGGTVYSSSISGVAAQPAGTVGNFLGAGPSATSPALMTFSTALSYVSFLWGSPDSFNTLVVNYLLNGTAQTASFTPYGTSLGLTTSDSYVQFTAGNGESITSLSFRSSQNAFETSNFRATAVPGPIAGAGIPALLVLGGLLSFRRRRARGTVAA